MHSNAPKISVVIASIVGPPFIDECVASVYAQKNAPEFEVIVVDCRGAENVGRLRQKFPQARFVELTQRETVPKLRRLGAEQARGEIVAIIEEHCLAKDDWLATIASSLTAEYVACGGPVFDNNFTRLRDWVTYFVEYNSSLPPWPDGATTFLNGANLAYRREALLENLALLDHGYWEATLNPKLLGEGKKFRSVPTMTAYHRGPFDYFYYLRQRYLFSRAFSGARRGSLSAGQRAAYLVAAPLVPFLLLARMAARVFGKKCRVGSFLASTPLIFPALCVYTVGEWMGYAFGPGRALLEVE
ncbi:MAG: glycosyltransferase [Acidobacteria bacterium]|nr:glycosyltransferase [Acidobacteriota bacterium]MCL5288761.1 glycosyltransferase [Acidobacteriota bacterium]